MTPQPTVAGWLFPLRAPQGKIPDPVVKIRLRKGEPLGDLVERQALRDTKPAGSFLQVQGIGHLGNEHMLP
jgi:hypothetical protein